jgi:hypothetical protein
MEEIIVNLHMHTRYSDGHGSHREIAEAAMRAGVDVVIVTDHNIWVDGPESYFSEGGRRVLLLVGEEIHDQARIPQKNHLLVFGAYRELAELAPDPQLLIDGVREAGGICFLAHPFDTENKTFNETDITWEAWDVDGYTGVELWNGLSEFKSVLKSRLHAIWYALNPERVPHGPPPEMLAKWDELLRAGRRVAAVGGSDAHKLPGRMGPLRRDIFPYESHFRSINTHVLLPKSLTGEAEADAKAVLSALRQGHCFIGNDLPAPTRGFRFHGQGAAGNFQMGDEVELGSGVTLQVRLPGRAECILLRDGAPFKTWDDREALVVHISQPGVFRLEAYRDYLGKRRGWIFSNPVYVRS